MIFWQVPVGDGPKIEDRKIDAVRIPSRSRVVVVNFTGNRQKFEDQIKNARMAEVIEIKQRVGRAVIGQAVVGMIMLKMAHRGLKCASLVLCRKYNRSLVTVCDKKLSVAVWRPSQFLCGHALESPATNFKNLN